MLQSVIEDLAKALDIEVPQPTDKGEFLFTFDDDIDVKILSLKKDRLTLVSAVSPALPDSDDSKKLLQNALQWNLTRLKDHEETLTWEPESNQIILVKEPLFSELSAKPLIKQLETFLNNVDFWKTALSPKKEANASKFPL